MSERWNHCALTAAQLRAVMDEPHRSADRVRALVGPRWDLRGFATSLVLVAVLCVLVQSAHERAFDVASVTFFVLMMSLMFSINARKAIHLARKGHACPGIVMRVVGGHLSTFQVQSVRGRFWLSTGMADAPEEGEHVAFFYGERGMVGACLSDGFAIGVRPSLVTMALLVVVGLAVLTSLGGIFWLFSPT